MGLTHSLVFAGAGSFKSMSAVATLLTWTGSAVVLHPAGELGAMTAAARGRMGHAVHRLDPRSGVGVNVMKQVLQGIHENSKSPLARLCRHIEGPGGREDVLRHLCTRRRKHGLAGQSGLRGHRVRKRLSDRRSARRQDHPIPTTLAGHLQTTPALARCVIGALLNSAYEADGAVQGRIFYLLDEAARLGPLKIIEVARDAGRKYGITLQLLYQSVGQLERQWGREGKREWYDGVSHRTYAAIQDIDTARELEETFGEYGVMVTSAGSHAGTSGKSFEVGARSRGRNENNHEVSRALIRREELMHDTRTDEAFAITRGARPLRCGRAIYFRRPDMVREIVANRFATISAK